MWVGDHFESEWCPLVVGLLNIHANVNNARRYMDRYSYIAYIAMNIYFHTQREHKWAFAVDELVKKVLKNIYICFFKRCFLFSDCNVIPPCVNRVNLMLNLVFRVVLCQRKQQTHPHHKRWQHWLFVSTCKMCVHIRIFAKSTTVNFNQLKYLLVFPVTVPFRGASRPEVFWQAFSVRNTLEDFNFLIFRL